ncbi:helicase domain-containing protein [Coprinopsis cinerea okayama7|uniref:DNA 3'-5' helicase n=1 Tax=Coprinopsis cinerea (strain Okayama-7 / 130 / ATCC MYA-4618 / FGSC 9003) TaxID=240176 RepID=A8NPM1_COPC7|nr:helicase domain-containing protein [Coprinopsis cinerea okayama7\|eukprot:XP_001835363.2 helicase domain-containing protein [Coprinopsis cinerea okayama7\
MEPTLTAYQGFPVVDHYGCPHCPTAGGQTYIRNHIVAKHAAEQAAQPQSPVHPIHTQRLNSAIFKTHVRVRKPSPSPNLDAPSNSTNFISQFESFHAFPPNPPQTIPNSRLISPWLKRCRWHLLVGSKDPLSLIDLVKTPGADDPLKWIPPLALQYYKQTSQLPDITHENVLHLINTSDATRGINHTPFQDVHQPETTHKQYSYVLARLLSALVRSPEGPNSLPLSIPLQKALCVFVEAKDLDSLQLVLEQLFFVEWSPTVQCPFPDPTLCFLAFINIKKKGEFSSPKDVTPDISKLTRLVRLCAINHYHSLVAQGVDSSSAWDRIKLFAFPDVVWVNAENDDYTTMLYKGHPVSVDGLRNVVKKIETTLLKVFHEDIIFDSSIRVNYSYPISDSLRNSEAGYSFISDPRNDFHHHRGLLANHIFSDPRLSEEFTISTPAGLQLNLIRVRQWLACLAEVEALTLLGVELTSGAPMRMTEIASTLARNTTTRTRNLMVAGPHVTIIGQYSKTSNNQQRDKILPHGVSSFFSDLLIQIHTHVRPLAQFFATHIWPDQPHVARLYQDLVFTDMGREFNSENLSKHLSMIAEPVLHWPMRVSDHRHINIALTRKLCKTSIDDLHSVDPMRVVHSYQAGHSPATEGRIYGLSHEETEGLSADTIVLFVRASISYQRVLKVVPSGAVSNYMQATTEAYTQPTTGPASPGSSPKPSDQALSAILRACHEPILKHLLALKGQMNHLQQSHDHIIQLLTNIPVHQPLAPATPNPFLDNDLDLEYVDPDPHPPPAVLATRSDAPPLPVSPDAPPLPPAAPQNPPQPQSRSDSLLTSQRIISTVHAQGTSSSLPPAFVSSDAPPLPPAAPQNPPQPARVQGTSDSSRTVQRIDNHTSPVHESTLLAHLSNVVRGPAKWRIPEQHAAVLALLQLKQDVVVCLRTGVGKSAVAIIPSMVEFGVTIIVVPFVSLLEDWKRRLTSARIPFHHFLGAQDTQPLGAHNIVLVSCDHHQPHDFDEAHVYFTDQDFRPDAMGEAYMIRKDLNCQVVLMSATLPPKAVTYLNHEFNLATPSVIRTSAARQELKLVLLPRACSTQESIVTFKEYFAKFQRRHPLRETDRYLIFVNSLKDGYAAKEALGLEFYHADSSQHPLSSREASAIYERWLQTPQGGLIASPAISAGTDYPSIRLTCHLSTPHSIVNFYQQASRAGRDGVLAHCVLIPRGYPSGPGSDTNDLPGRQKVINYADAKGFSSCVIGSHG